ncbi:MAG: alpha-L-rhamnosidase N-terminal domain-containing protein, partial [Planctomycetota bacterium]|nr:alpha-L-rhamnosidase N-terminal domain-containing protein [Planctomycetota bacterium]
MPKPLFIWLDRQGLGRHVNAYFRRDFTLAALPRQALLHIFADSNYHLKVNGAFVGYGPARFQPAEPEYDTWDIAPFLRCGANAIAVHVVAHGMSTFMTALNRGGLIAWGTIPNGAGKPIDLSTPGAWLCRKATGYDQEAPIFSFTSNAIDIFDARQDVPDWDKAHVRRQGWHKPVILEAQNSWGPLRPRSIPHLTQREIIPERLLGAYPLRAVEKIFSFRLAKPWEMNTREAMSERKRVFACTWIHSPRRQRVRAGLFWGEYFLNGRELKKEETRPDQVNR